MAGGPESGEVDRNLSIACACARGQDVDNYCPRRGSTKQRRVQVVRSIISENVIHVAYTFGLIGGQADGFREGLDGRTQ
jgi:hypothetical protein